MLREWQGCDGRRSEFCLSIGIVFLRIFHGFFRNINANRFFGYLRQHRRAISRAAGGIQYRLARSKLESKAVSIQMLGFQFLIHLTKHEAFTRKLHWFPQFEILCFF